MEKRVRSRYFLLSGGLGGLAGFVLMEGVTFFSQGSGSSGSDILWKAVYFAGFGLTVGTALGMTEGLVQKKRNRMVYGLLMGLVLGVVGGFMGGAVGQSIYRMLPAQKVPSNVDIAIALDSSESMNPGFLVRTLAGVQGNDPDGLRRKAAEDLVDRLSDTDRVAVVDFDDVGKVMHPLTALNSQEARQAALQAIKEIDDSGGTNLSAGLDLAIEELSQNKVEGRRQFVIFLTDGDGPYDGAAEQRAQSQGIVIYTIGLGAEVKADVLSSVALATGGKYYPVSDASQLSLLFHKIYDENRDMTKVRSSNTGNSMLHIVLRILSWAMVGLAVGAGQGVRENTREDLRACSLGGFLGGAVGGALFDPVANTIALGAGLVGRCLADVVVGACIGGSMRLAQQHIVEVPGKQTTTLLSVLPQKGGLTVLPEPAGKDQKPMPAPPPAAQPRPVPVPRPVPAPVPVPVSAAPATSSRPSLASYQEKYADRAQAMAMAYRSGDFTLREIAEHFGVQSTTVKRAAEQYAGA